MRRPRYTGEAAVNEAVYRLMNKFEYPDELGGGGPVVPSGGGGAPTIVIAASDASDISKSKADYVCTGVNDHDVIQQALNQLDTSVSGPGGRVLFTEGIFNCAYGEIRASDVFGQAPVHFQGMGKGTILSFDTGTGIALDLNSEGGTASHFRLLGNDVNGVTGINLDGQGQLVTGVKVERLGNGGAAIFVEDSDNSIVKGNLLLDNLGDGVSGRSSPRLVVGNNAIIDISGKGVDLFECDDAVVTGNAIQSADNSLIDDQAAGVVVGNTFNNRGLSVVDSYAILAEGNSFSAVGEYGISLSNVLRSSIEGNLIVFAGLNAPNTYDGIILSGNTERLLVTGNKIVTSANQIRYGINVADGTCICNIVVGNDLGPTGDYGTDALNDVGADTQLFYPADPIYGDNFIGCYGS